MQLSILIAVYNEAATVGELLERVWAQPVAGIDKEIIIVESHSSDGSRDIVAQFLARHAGESSPRIQVLREPRPMGKGHAIRQALAVASGDIVLIQDADLEYDTADYPALIRPILEGRTAVVLGSRHIGPQRWRIRKFARHRWQAAAMNLGGMLFHGFFNLLFGSHLSDPTSMYKVFRADCLEGLSLRCNRFDFDFELLGKLLRAGFTPLEVPVAYSSRGFDQGKKIRVLRDPISWLIAIVRCRFEPLAASRAHPAVRAAPAASAGEIATVTLAARE